MSLMSHTGQTTLGTKERKKIETYYIAKKQNA